MSKMPEPVAEVCSGHALHWAGSGPIAPLCERTGAKVGSLLISTTQAEAYADARVREVQQWQPIETAPQGQIALFYDADATEVRHCMFVDWMVDGAFCGNRHHTATHWAPLPAPPKQ